MQQELLKEFANYCCGCTCLHHRSLHRFIANRNHQRMCRYRLLKCSHCFGGIRPWIWWILRTFSNLCSYLKVWNFQIEIYCIPVHPRNHSRTGNHVISSSVSTACSLCFSKYFRTNIRHDFYSWPAGIALVACCVHFLLLFCRIGTQKIKSKRVEKTKNNDIMRKISGRVVIQ